MAREEKLIQCPHCMFFIPVTGEGSRTVVKAKKVKEVPVIAEGGAIVEAPVTKKVAKSKSKVKAAA